jgi:hypothetical protein
VPFLSLHNHDQDLSQLPPQGDTSTGCRPIFSANVERGAVSRRSTQASTARIDEI